MTTQRTAIAVPAELLASIDKIARERGLSRSRFITNVLRRVVEAKRDRQVTEQLDALFRDPQLTKAHADIANEFEQLDELDGAEW